MATVTLKIGGRDYQLACDNGEEERLKALASMVDSRLQTIAPAMAQAGEKMQFVMLMLTMADELDELNDEVDSLRTQLENVSGSFEQGKAIDMEKILTRTLSGIAERIERITARAREV